MDAMRLNGSAFYDVSDHLRAVEKKLKQQQSSLSGFPHEKAESHGSAPSHLPLKLDHSSMPSFLRGSSRRDSSFESKIHCRPSDEQNF